MKNVFLFILIILLLSSLGCDVPSKKVKAYFIKDSRLATVDRIIPTIEKPLMIAITELMKGPNPTEQAKGFSTTIPVGTQARRIDREGNVAIIDFNARLADFDGDSKEVQKMLAQIIYTATGIRKVKYVLFKLQGKDMFELGSEGYLVDHPLERSDLKF